MSVLTLSQSATAPFSLSTSNLYRLNVHEYERIGPALDESRVELLDGYLVKKVSKNPRSLALVPLEIVGTARV